MAFVLIVKFDEYTPIWSGLKLISIILLVLAGNI